MMIIVVNLPPYILGDKKSVLCNTIVLYYTLKNKAKSIVYHIVRGVAARDELNTSVNLLLCIFFVNTLVVSNKNYA